MHIPDGYLSPATCAVLYAGAMPFWYIALQKINKLLSTRLVPLLSVFAAFSFVIMMFNLPLPGGTTGHAVGIGIAAIVLGRWGGMLAISVALLIQAIFFGDGGITALGANCFNMAIAGSFVAYGTYQLFAGQSPVNSSRRVFAAGAAGYAAINVAALLAAIEFGIQPMFFKDAAGTPLYAPYSLGIAIPAMMIGHLTFAGLAEMVITGGLVAFLQRSDPSLLKMTAAGAAVSIEDEPQNIAGGSSWRSTRPLWIGLAVLMILTPLGLLAAGTAWGEWGAQDFNDPAVREQITAASSGNAPPESAPQGLEHLSSIWTSPISDYAPPFMHNASFGYIMSAMFGIGLILLTSLLLGWMTRRRQKTNTIDNE